jgi:hypothetical protein
MGAGGDFLLVNTGCEEWNYQVRDLANAVANVFPEVEVSVNKHAQPDKRSYKVDFSRFRKLALHHQPQVTLLGTIQELREGLQAMRFRDTDFRNSSLVRLKELSNLCEKGLLTEQLKWQAGTRRLTRCSSMFQNRCQVRSLD